MKPHNQNIRLQAIKLHQQQHLSINEISRRLSVSPTSISTWLKVYELEGEKGLFPDYSACGRASTFSLEIISKALEYKSAHPKWGAPFILVKLEDDFPNQPLPKVRRLQEIFKEKNLQPQLTRLPKEKAIWAKKVFDRVQVDAKECLKTSDGQPCCYLNFTDEYTGSVLNAFIFPLCQN